MFGLFRSPATAPRPAARPRLRVQSLEDRATPAGLGSAAGYGVLGINGGAVRLNDAAIVGNVGLAPNENGSLKKTTVTGSLVEDPTATADLGNRQNAATIRGGVTTVGLSQAAQDANAASALFAGLLPTRVYGAVNRSLTITGSGGTNVIRLASLNFNGDTLTLRGGASDVFVINVTGRFTFHRSRIQLVGGVTASHVIFNFPTTGPEIDLSGRGSVVNGTFLAPRRGVDFHDVAEFNGAVISRTISIHDGGRVNYVGFDAPDAQPPATLAGRVYVDNVTANGPAFDQLNDYPLEGVTVTLTGTDAQGNAVSLTTKTDVNGNYSFKDLRPGTYTLTVGPATDFMLKSGAALPGTVDGSADGTAAGKNAIGSISLDAGDAGVGYDFAFVPSGVQR